MKAAKSASQKERLKKRAQRKCWRCVVPGVRVRLVVSVTGLAPQPSLAATQTESWCLGLDGDSAGVILFVTLS